MSEQLIIEILRQHLERNHHTESEDRHRAYDDDASTTLASPTTASSPNATRGIGRSMNEIIRSLVVEGLRSSDQIHTSVDQPRRTNVHFTTPHHDYTTHTDADSENTFFSQNNRNRTDTSHGHSENHIPRSSLNFPEFDELIYLYNRNIQEYQYTVQEMTERMELNHRRNTRQQNTLLDNFIYPYHRNMQEYNQVTLRCLDVLQNLNALRVTQPIPPNNNNTHAPTGIPPLRSRPMNTEIRSGTQNRNIIPEIFNISRPIEYGFTFYPNVVPRNVITPQHTNHLLTPAQIALTTREYIFQESDRSTLNTTPVCPIMLEEFQIGNNIRQIVHCGHQFLSSSLERWFRRSCCCPVCRYNLWDISATEPYRASDQNPPVTLSPLDLVVGGFHPPDHSRANSMVDQDRLLDMEPDVSTTFLSTMSPHSLMTSSPNATVLRTSTLGSNLLSLPPISQRILDIPLSADTSTDISNTDMNIESIAENTIRNWISSFLQNQPNQFPNIDLDISYTVEYDYTDGSNNSV